MICGRFGCQFRFDQLPGFIDIDRLFKGNRRYGEPLVIFMAQQPLGHQSKHGFPQRRVTDAELLAQFMMKNFLPDIDAAVQKGLTNMLIGSNGNIHNHSPVGPL